MKTFGLVLREMQDYLGYNFFENTRRRECVEGRSLLYHYLSKYKGCGLVEITRMVEDYIGRKPNHATVHHAIEMYDVYASYNPTLNEALLAVVGHFNNSEDKKQYIKNTITKLPSQIVNEIHEKVREEYKKQLLEEELIKNSLKKSL